MSAPTVLDVMRDVQAAGSDDEGGAILARSGRAVEVREAFELVKLAMAIRAMLPIPAAPGPPGPPPIP